jgi:hypothetical protein
LKYADTLGVIWVVADRLRDFYSSKRSEADWGTIAVAGGLLVLLAIVAFIVALVNFHP